MQGLGSRQVNIACGVTSRGRGRGRAGLVYSSPPVCVHSQPCNEESAMNEGRCPQCGEPTSGKFCSSCGSSLVRSTCPGCRAPLNPGARFCHICGRPMGKRQRGPTHQARTHPGWIAAAALMAVSALVWAVRVGRDPNTSRPPTTALPAAAPAPDISGMTPRERANAVFDRIMAAAERGDSAQIEFFRPMALGAYALLDSPDSDTRYDVGMIHLITGDVEGARAQLDSLKQFAPNHLLGTMLQSTLAQVEQDESGMRQAYRDFLDHYEAEIATAGTGYADHRPAIDAFLDVARRELGRND